ncbi:MAG: diguanylate cyclase [Gammaproteobacteria bacterium]|nr:diguanylate cyclase [Gammaproteobacteria bacterium]
MSQYSTFPTLFDIATQEIISTPERSTLIETLELMNRYNLHNVVVDTGDPKRWGLFSSAQIIRAIHTGAVTLEQRIVDCGYPPLICLQAEESIIEIFPGLLQSEEYYGVIDEDGTLVGIASYTDIVNSIDPSVIIETRNIGQLLEKRAVVTLEKDAPVGDALLNLETVDDCVIVVENDLPIGILTSKDALKWIRPGWDDQQAVEHCMSQPLVTLKKDATIKETIIFMNSHSFKRVVVTHNDRLVGVISQKEISGYAFNHWAEVIRSHANELQELVKVLEQKAARLELASNTDVLTELGNRRYLNERLEAEIGRYYRYKSSSFCFALIDLDHFKQINDHHGHLVGDQVLKEIAALLKKCIRETDSVARWGGEEFAILFPMTELQEVEVLTNRIRLRIAQLHPHGIAVSASFGIGQYREGEAMSDLLQKCDQRLYQAKAAGRNCVVGG